MNTFTIKKTHLAPVTNSLTKSGIKYAIKTPTPEDDQVNIHDVVNLIKRFKEKYSHSSNYPRLIAEIRQMGYTRILVDLSSDEYIKLLKTLGLNP